MSLQLSRNQGEVTGVLSFKNSLILSSSVMRKVYLSRFADPFSFCDVDLGKRQTNLAQNKSNKLCEHMIVYIRQRTCSKTRKQVYHSVRMCV